MDRGVFIGMLVIVRLGRDVDDDRFFLADAHPAVMDAGRTWSRAGLWTPR